ncbi:hypothetical protein NQ314_008167 [Rhamnusium bicolor]|uniref:Uncharacterized protein n=1 Tax=Rhamnusium bicolor TaxID=1586634 RepID=A0AAV8YFM3_9CUCU|nr:hypothetical protein NQ314_008167 [Rhamnusium bicolor]
MILELKRVSLCSIQSDKIDNKLREKWKEAEPRDRFYIVHVLFVLMGLMHFLPYTFFLTANAVSTWQVGLFVLSITILSIISDKYFVPVITFLFSDVIGLLGRIANNKLNVSINGYVLNIIMFIRMLIFIPLIYFCNALPRQHSSVLLPHDWQYITILGVFGFTNGYILNMIFLELGKLVEPEKLEAVFMVFMACSGVIGTAIIPTSIVAVELL